MSKNKSTKFLFNNIDNSYVVTCDLPKMCLPKKAELFNLPTTICRRQFADSQFAQKNIVFDIFILSAVKS